MSKINFIYKLHNIAYRFYDTTKLHIFDPYLIEPYKGVSYYVTAPEVIRDILRELNYE